MKNNKLTIMVGALISSTLFVAGAASAQENVYVNAGVTQHHTKNTDTASITGKVGTQINPYFGVEAEGGFGVNEDTYQGVKYKNKGDLGAYAVGTAPVNDKFSVLGRIGYHHTWEEAKAAGLKVKNDDGSFAAGVGAQYMLDTNNGIRADYTRYTEQKVDNFGVSYVHKF